MRSHFFRLKRKEETRAFGREGPEAIEMPTINTRHYGERRTVKRLRISPFCFHIGPRLVEMRENKTHGPVRDFLSFLYLSCIDKGEKKKSINGVEGYASFSSGWIKL